MPKVGQPGYLEVGNQILCVNDEGEVIFKTKTKKRKRFTTRSGPSKAQNEDMDNNDADKWVLSSANSAGWFRIYHPASKKFLTSSKKRGKKGEKFVKIEDKANLEKSKDKELVQMKKVFVYCPYIEEFVTHIANERNYEDQDLQIDLGLDGGGDFFKIMMSVQPVKQINNDSAV